MQLQLATTSLLKYRNQPGSNLNKINSNVKDIFKNDERADDHLFILLRANIPGNSLTESTAKKIKLK